jgi:DHA1 family tetracycline resistance protein-like MFS transporter
MTYAFVLYTSFRFGYDAEKNGYLFAFVGVISILVQGMLFGRLVKMFGETALIVVGCAVLVLSLFALPFIGPTYGGVSALLVGLAVMSFGNSLASPGLTSLASKSAHEHDQGRTMGIMQSGASLARTVGPLLGGFLLNNALNAIDDDTIYRTFWAASIIMFIALVVAIFFARSSPKHSNAA